MSQTAAIFRSVVNAAFAAALLVGVLASGELDNGRGRARLHCFNHRHEIESGRTSSVGEQILGR